MKLLIGKYTAACNSLSRDSEYDCKALYVHAMSFDLCYKTSGHEMVFYFDRNIRDSKCRTINVSVVIP